MQAERTPCFHLAGNPRNDLRAVMAGPHGPSQGLHSASWQNAVKAHLIADAECPRGHRPPLRVVAGQSRFAPSMKRSTEAVSAPSSSSRGSSMRTSSPLKRARCTSKMLKRARCLKKARHTMSGGSLSLYTAKSRSPWRVINGAPTRVIGGMAAPRTSLSGFR